MMFALISVTLHIHECTGDIQKHGDTDSRQSHRLCDTQTNLIKPIQKLIRFDLTYQNYLYLISMEGFYIFL